MKLSAKRLMMTAAVTGLPAVPGDAQTVTPGKTTMTRPGRAYEASGK